VTANSAQVVSSPKLFRACRSISGAIAKPMAEAPPNADDEHADDEHDRGQGVCPDEQREREPHHPPSAAPSEPCRSMERRVRGGAPAQRPSADDGARRPSCAGGQRRRRRR
jgi:hypothetical protein